MRFLRVIHANRLCISTLSKRYQHYNQMPLSFGFFDGIILACKEIDSLFFLASTSFLKVYQRV